MDGINQEGGEGEGYGRDDVVSNGNISKKEEEREKMKVIITTTFILRLVMRRRRSEEEEGGDGDGLHDGRLTFTHTHLPPHSPIMTR